MAPEKNLKQIVSSFYVAEIQDTPLLFHRESGEVSSINNSAALFINLAQTGLSDQEIITEVSAAHSISETKIHQDLADLRSHLTHIKPNPEISANTDGMPIEDFKAGPFSTPKATCFYKIGNIRFRISYPDSETYEICHAILSALSIAPPPRADFAIEINEGLNGWAILLDGKIQHAIEDSTSVADILRTVILDTIGSKLGNWIGLHAAGVLSPAGKVLLLAAPSGSGKSTLALELMLAGFEYLGDDTQILNLDTQEVWPFPTSANLKPGSWPLFEKQLPELTDIQIFRPDTRPVKFLPIKLDLEEVNRPYKTRALLFPEYNEDTEGSIEKIGPSVQIKLLSDSGCYSKIKANSTMSPEIYGIHTFHRLLPTQIQFIKAGN